ncbi:DNA internalization-related competence protein ComEC/Rec2 [Halobacillus massiliensis]|uniref:DNA internalization-related competence protein ComEC/Rec2 n=1 Tax=Halobacillus massiliensis TaxID=1926286 RepID=UPI0009E34165|nr:DNA internalization-related competence protein ComEC/Rec2 [Halobacillus massiliensis]
MRGTHHLAAIAFIAGAVTSEFEGYHRFLLGSIVIIWISSSLFSWKWKGSLLICFSAGALLAISNSSPPPIEVTTDTPLYVKIVSPLKKSSSAYQAVLYHPSSRHKIQLSFLITDKSENEARNAKNQLKYGAECTLTSEVLPPDKARNYGQFDYRKYLENQGIYYQSVVSSSNEILCEGEGFYQSILDARETIIDRVKNSMDYDLFKWTSALIFGDTSLLDEETITWFRQFSLSHILAISGLHIGLFISGLYVLFYRSGWITIEQTHWIVLIILPCYSFLAGGAPSVLRASFMAVVCLLLIQGKLRFPVTDVLAWAAVLLLLWNPNYLHNIGYQFSFLVSFGLVLSASFLKKQSSWKLPATVSLISQLTILPLQLHYFYQFNPLSLFANLLLVPYFSLLVIPLLFLLVILSMITGELITRFLSGMLSQLHEGFLAFTMEIGKPFNIQWTVGEFPFEWIGIYWITFSFMMFFWVQEKRKPAFAYSVLAVGIMAAYSLLPYISPKGSITMLDVGQGDTFVIELPYRRSVILIDAAGSPSFSSDKNAVFNYVIDPYLLSRGIRTIEAVFISHEDNDHSGSLDSLIQNYKIGHIFTHPYSLKGKGERHFLKAEKVVQISGTEFHILHPSNDLKDENDNSLVLYVELGGKKWLFTGDISKHVEKDIIEKYPQLEADVLKLAHHGSNTSTSLEWIRGLNPSVALISAGVNNQYGHPHEEIIELVENEELLILRTDEHGAVTYRFTKEKGTFSTYLPYNAKKKP